MLKKINPSNTVQKSTLMKTNASQAEELLPVIDPTGDQPPTATHTPEFTINQQTLFTQYLQTQRINTQKITQG